MNVKPPPGGKGSNPPNRVMNVNSAPIGNDSNPLNNVLHLLLLSANTKVPEFTKLQHSNHPLVLNSLGRPPGMDSSSRRQGMTYNNRPQGMNYSSRYQGKDYRPQEFNNMTQPEIKKKNVNAPLPPGITKINHPYLNISSPSGSRETSNTSATQEIFLPPRLSKRQKRKIRQLEREYMKFNPHLVDDPDAVEDPELAKLPPEQRKEKLAAKAKADYERFLQHLSALREKEKLKRSYNDEDAPSNSDSEYSSKQLSRDNSKDYSCTKLFNDKDLPPPPKVSKYEEPQAKEEDRLESFASYVVSKLHTLDTDKKIYAEKLISDIIFEAEYGNLKSKKLADM